MTRHEPAPRQTERGFTATQFYQAAVRRLLVSSTFNGGAHCASGDVNLVAPGIKAGLGSFCLTNTSTFDVRSFDLGVLDPNPLEPLALTMTREQTLIDHLKAGRAAALDISLSAPRASQACPSYLIAIPGSLHPGSLTMQALQEAAATTEPPVYLSGQLARQPLICEDFKGLSRLILEPAYDPQLAELYQSLTR